MIQNAEVTNRQKNELMMCTSKYPLACTLMARD